MTEWIWIITLATRGTQIRTIITLIRSTIQSAKNDLRHTLKLNSNENYRHRISESVLVFATERIRTLSGNPRNVFATDTRKIYIFFQAPRRRCEITTEHYRWNNTNFGTCR